MRTGILLHVIGIAALALTVAGGSARARHAPSHSQSQSLAAAIAEAACPGAPPRMTRAATFVAEVLLDRLDISPGVIDGKAGSNAGKAIAAFQRSRGLTVSGKLDRATWDKLCDASTPALIAYTIADEDVRGPFVPQIPRDLEAMSKLTSLGYRSAAQLLAEKFHTSEEVIAELNPGKAVDRAGTVITVPNVAGGRPAGQVVRIEVDKLAGTVRALGHHDELVAFYPASVGSTEKPAPTGTFQVRRIARDPTWHYDPKFQFKGVKTNRDVTIAPGPNNPVGVVWIEITKESYGIHGTSHPETIGKTGSHGCVRLTNWDALDLAGRVRKGTTVAFLDAQTASRQQGG